VFDEQGTFSEATEVWNFAVAAWEILMKASQKPFPKLASQKELAYFYRQEKTRMCLSINPVSGGINGWPCN
jgi:hypothetical protein